MHGQTTVKRSEAAPCGAGRSRHRPPAGRAAGCARTDPTQVPCVAVRYRSTGTTVPCWSPSRSRSSSPACCTRSAPGPAPGEPDHDPHPLPPGKRTLRDASPRPIRDDAAVVVLLCSSLTSDWMDLDKVVQSEHVVGVSGVQREPMGVGDGRDEQISDAQVMRPAPHPQARLVPRRPALPVNATGCRSPVAQHLPHPRLAPGPHADGPGVPRAGTRPSACSRLMAARRRRRPAGRHGAHGALAGDRHTALSAHPPRHRRSGAGSVRPDQEPSTLTRGPTPTADGNTVGVVGDHEVVALRTRFATLDAGRSADLRCLTPEQAATAMCELFRSTGCAQAGVSDPAEVRRLARLDCRRRGIRVTTLAVGNVVVIYDDDRHDAFMATPEGEQTADSAIEALARVRGPHPRI